VSRTRLAIAIFVVIGAAIAVVTVGGAVRNASQERGRLLSLAEDLEAERTALDRLEQALIDQEAQLTDSERALIDLRNWITTIELRYPRGIPSNVYGEYTEAVDRYNTGIDEYNAAADTYHTAQEEYVARVDSFNARVQEAQGAVEDLKDLGKLLRR
jgi:chromosome segregation ATPase